MYLYDFLMDTVKRFIENYFTYKVYLIGLIGAVVLFVYGVTNLTPETNNLIPIQIGIFLFWCLGNLKFVSNALFFEGFSKKFWLFIAIWFNLLTLAWLVEFLTDFKIMGMIMGIS